MKTPPLLLGVVLLFWGWQSDFLVAGAVMAVILESARFIKVRWDISDEDFTRIWTLCSVLVLAAIAFAFTNNGGTDSFRGLLDNPGLAAQRSAGNTVARTANSVVRWLPMTFFLFVAAQTYSSRDKIPLATISLILQRRWKRAKKFNQPLPVSPGMNVSYPYFAICLIAASIHPGGNTRFFWGLCALLTWAMWSQRSRRFGLISWTVALGTAVVLGYYGQFGIGQLQQLIENSGLNLFSHFSRRGFDPTQSRTQLGKIGEVKTSSRIVIRLQPKNGSRPPMYLREASYRVFRSPVWATGGTKDPFEAISAGPTNTTWSMLPAKPTTATNQIACYLEDRSKDGTPTGLLPLPSGSARLENLPAYVLQKNSLGAVLAEGPGLVIFDACSGMGETIDSPPGTNDVDTLPDVEAAALDQVIASLKLDDKSIGQKLQAIQGYFQNEFDYSTWQSPGKPFSTNDTPLARFLLQTRHGHCEYFATATVLLLRRAGIPARYAVGYAVHETSGSGYVVRLSDAHAWCLVWRDGYWEDYDTTPTSWVEVESRKRSPFQLLSDAWSRIKFEISKLRWGQTQLQRYLLYLLVPVLVFLVYQIIFRRRWRKQQRKIVVATTPTNWPGLDSEFYQLEHKLAERGVIRQPGETLGDWLERSTADSGLRNVNPTVRTLLNLHYRYRFDPAGLDKRDRETLRRETTNCLITVVPDKG